MAENRSGHAVSRLGALGAGGKKMKIFTQQLFFRLHRFYSAFILSKKTTVKKPESSRAASVFFYKEKGVIPMYNEESAAISVRLWNRRVGI